MASFRDKQAFFAQLDAFDDVQTDSEDASSQEQPAKRMKIGPRRDQHERVEEVHPRPRGDRGKARERTDQTIHISSSPPITSVAHVLPAYQPRRSSRTSKSVRVSDSPPSSPKGHLPCNQSDRKLFDGFKFFFIPNDDINKVRKLRIQSAKANGAVWARLLDSSVTHIICDPDIDAKGAAKVVGNLLDLSAVAIVNNAWLVESLSHKDVRDVWQSRFQLKGAKSPQKAAQKLDACQTKSIKPSINSAASQSAIDALKGDCYQSTRAAKSDDLTIIIEDMKKATYLPFDEELDLDKFLSPEDDDENQSQSSVSDSTMPKENRGFACMEPDNGKVGDNPNKRTIEILQRMATYYDRSQDQFRTLAYRKAIAALRKQTDLISNKEAARALFGIGNSIAEKIEEIVTTDRLDRLDHISSDPHDRTLQLFTGIYGVGLNQAKRWMAQGHETLDDLRTGVALTSNQRIGLEHYDDFQQRIPRAEVEKHGLIVQKALSRFDKKLQGVIGGSYRRGMPDSGDIDVMIIHPTAELPLLRQVVFDKVVPYLFETGFFKAALAISRSTKRQQTTPAKKPPKQSHKRHTSRDIHEKYNFSNIDSTGTKFHGASQLNASLPWRRIDLLLVPASSIGASLLYFTGNDIFNRSMRLLASRKGMRLNQYGLYKNVMRGPGRVKQTEGELLESRSEKKIFELLGVPWRRPEERRC